MTKRLQKWREIGVVNLYHYTKTNEVYIRFRDNLMFGPRGYIVTNIGAPMADGSGSGGKLFSTLLEAQAWAKKVFYIYKWSRTPFGTWMDAHLVARRNKEFDTLAKRVELFNTIEVGDMVTISNPNRRQITSKAITYHSTGFWYLEPIEGMSCIAMRDAVVKVKKGKP